MTFIALSSSLSLSLASPPPRPPSSRNIHGGDRNAAAVSEGLRKRAKRGNGKRDRGPDERERESGRLKIYATPPRNIRELVPSPLLYTSRSPHAEALELITG
jgi:hypothetical protein